MADTGVRKVNGDAYERTGRIEPVGPPVDLEGFLVKVQAHDSWSWLVDTRTGAPADRVISLSNIPVRADDYYIAPTALFDRLEEISPTL